MSEWPVFEARVQLVFPSGQCLRLARVQLVFPSGQCLRLGYSWCSRAASV